MEYNLSIPNMVSEPVLGFRSAHRSSADRHQLAPATPVPVLVAVVFPCPHRLIWSPAASPLLIGISLARLCSRRQSPSGSISAGGFFPCLDRPARIDLCGKESLLSPRPDRPTSSCLLGSAPATSSPRPRRSPRQLGSASWSQPCQPPASLLLGPARWESARRIASCQIDRPCRQNRPD
jgi:hypothetical protein